MADRFSRVPIEAAADRRLTATDLRVLIALCSWVNQSGHAYPRPSSIAIRSGIDRRNLPGSTARLEACGYVKVVKNGRGKLDFWIHYRPEMVPVDPKDEADIVIPSDDNLSCGDMTNDPVVMPGHDTLSSPDMTLVMPGHEPRTAQYQPIEQPSREKRGTRLPETSLPDDWRDWAVKERPDLNLDRVFANFKDHWTAAAGAKGRKADWAATWRVWVRRERHAQSRGGKAPTAGNGFAQLIADGFDRPGPDELEPAGFDTGGDAG